MRRPLIVAAAAAALVLVPRLVRLALLRFTGTVVRDETHRS